MHEDSFSSKSKCDKSLVYLQTVRFCQSTVLHRYLLSLNPSPKQLLLHLHLMLLLPIHLQCHYLNVPGSWISDTTFVRAKVSVCNADVTCSHWSNAVGQFHQHPYWSLHKLFQQFCCIIGFLVIILIKIIWCFSHFHCSCWFYHCFCCWYCTNLQRFTEWQ